MRNTNMRKGFTMIELIFVIVIIGILAAVAIPKLAATRDDAKISAIVANARTFKGDLAAYYTSQGASVWDNNATNTAASSVPVRDAACTGDANTTLPQGQYSLCDGTFQCLSLVTASPASLTVTKGSDATEVVCDGVIKDPTIAKMILEGKITFGGVGVNRN